MTPASATRPVLIALALTLAGCGAVEGDSHRFQTMAEHVAAIDIPLDPAKPERARPVRSAEAAGLRPARLQVAVMDPHDMWDARDAQASGLRVDVADFVRPVAEAAAPAVARATVDRVAERVPLLQRASAREETRDLRRPTVAAERRTIQLGAFSSEAGARAAWARLKDRAELAALSPVFQPVEIDGRTLTRLKVAASAETAEAICRAAQVVDPWCRRAG